MRNKILVFIMVFILCACKEHKPSKVNLKIIQTTDVHGTIFPYNFIEQKEAANSLATIYTLVKQTRNENPDRVILLDNGDYLQGQPSVYYYNFEDTVSPHLGAQVLNYMQYDATTVGNHDIETGHAVYDRYRTQLNMPFMAANALDKKTGNPYFEPYTIIERQGIKVAVLGLITPGISQWLPENLWSGMEFEDMVESANKWVKIIHEKEQPDLVIGMFHAGVDHAYNNPEGVEFMNENASRLVAEKVAGIDIVLAGHDHKKHFEKVLNFKGDTVILLDPRSHSRAVSFIDIDFTLNKTNGLYEKNIKAEIIDIQDYNADADFLATFNEQYNEVKKYVSRQIGEFASTMDSKEGYFGNSSFMDFIHTVQLDISGADISFASPLSFHTTVEKGPVYVSDLFKLYKYENQLYTLNLTGKEVDGFLEYSVSEWFNTMRNKSDNLLRINQDETGRYSFVNQYYNFSSASGIEYLVDVSKPDGNKVKILGFSSGRHFYADSSYTVALNSYRATGGGGHLTSGAGISVDELKNRVVSSTEHDIRYLIMKWIEEKQVIHPKKNTNWRIIPENYYEQGKQKDMKLLFE
jgi:2',3'-cyclic-nucleotide 2'-phosphodiesterase/3'-nucleotidase